VSYMAEGFQLQIQDLNLRETLLNKKVSIKADDDCIKYCLIHQFWVEI
jgi:hypothetical protein